MPKITIQTDCGNSPKMTFLKELNIAFANGDIDDILNRVSDDITWELVGGRKLDGLDAFSKELEKMKENLPSEFILDLVVTHGKSGAANGIIIAEDNKKYAFADFYTFSNAKGNRVQSITTYMIALDSK